MKGQTVLITGGTGTFGTAFVQYALKVGAARVLTVSTCGHRIAALKKLVNDSRLECRTGNVRDSERMAEVMGVNPDIVVHAAAMKRVEQCDDEPDEARKTNVEGTLNVVREARKNGVTKVLLISSDKATSPETTYGKTKAYAEEIAIGQNAYRGSGHTRISVVRYGNVLGSQGSFLETLFEARRTGKPVPMTDPGSTRFWWTIDEAVAFVASVLDRMQGAEIWVPKLTSSTVFDLAKAIAPQSELIPMAHRGHEKIHEAMVNDTEARYAWECPDCYVILPKEGQWWSAQAPGGAVKVDRGFSYRSDSNPLPVRFEEVACASA